MTRTAVLRGPRRSDAGRRRDPVRFDHPANAGILAHLGDPARLRGSVSAAKDRRSCAPSEVDDASTSLGAHPDLLEQFWDRLGRSLPTDCRWIVHGTPVLVHPGSGVIFAFGGGTGTLAFRLPDEVRAQALQAGAKTVHVYPAYPYMGVEASRLDLAEIGREWVFGDHDHGAAWCRAAFDAAGSLAE